MAAPSSELAARLRKRDAAAPGTRKLSHVEERDLRLRKRKEREAYVANMKELLDAEKDLQIKPDAVDFDVRSDTEIKLRWRLPGQDHYHRTLSKRAKFKKAKVAKLQAEIDQDPYKGKTIVYRVEYRKTDYSSWMWGGLFSAPRACDMRRTRQCFLQGLEPETTYSVRIGAAILPPWELRDDPKVLEEKEKETAELAAAAKAKGKAKGAGAGAGAAKKSAPQPKIRSIDEDDMDIDPELLPWTWSDMIPCPKPTMTSKEVQERLADRLRKREEKFETLAAETQNKIIAAQLERQEQEEQRAALEEEDRKKQLREAQQFLELQQKQAAMTVQERFEQGKQRILLEEKRLTASMFSEESRKRLEERARKKKERMAAGKPSGGEPTAPGDAPVDAAGAASGEAPAPIAASSAAPEGGAAEPASSGSGAGGGDDAPAAGEAGHTPSVSNNVIAVAVAEADEANARLSRRYTETQRVMSAATVQMNQAKDLAEKASEALRAATTVAAAGGADADEAEDPTAPTSAGAASGSGSADTGALLKASDEATDRVVQLRTLRTCLVEELGVLSSAMQQMWNEPLGPSPADEAVLVDLGLPKEVARAVLLAVPAGEEAASSSGGWLGGLMGSSSNSGGGVSAARVEGVGKAVAALQEVKAYLKRARAGSADVGSGAAAGGAGGDSTPVPADHEDAKWKGVVPEVEVVLMGTSALGAALRNKKSVEEAVKAMQAEMRKRLQDVAVSSEAREMAKEEAGKKSSD